MEFPGISAIRFRTNEGDGIPLFREHNRSLVEGSSVVRCLHLSDSRHDLDAGRNEHHRSLHNPAVRFTNAEIDQTRRCRRILGEVSVGRESEL